MGDQRQTHAIVVLRNSLVLLDAGIRGHSAVLCSLKKNHQAHIANFKLPAQSWSASDLLPPPTDNSLSDSGLRSNIAVDLKLDTVAVALR